MLQMFLVWTLHEIRMQGYLNFSSLVDSTHDPGDTKLCPFLGTSQYLWKCFFSGLQMTLKCRNTKLQTIGGLHMALKCRNTNFLPLVNSTHDQKVEIPNLSSFLGTSQCLCTQRQSQPSNKITDCNSFEPYQQEHTSRLRKTKIIHERVLSTNDKHN